MSIRLKHAFDRFRRNTRGNITVMAVTWMTAFTGTAGLVTDVSFFYYAKNKLQSTTDAAALAAVHDINGTNTDAQILATAAAYSSTAGNRNADSRFTATMATGYPQLRCFAQVVAQGIPCVSASGQTSANGIVIKQNATVPTYFAKMLGYSSTTISATSSAAYKGGGTTNLDVFFVIDTTASMDSTTSANCGSGVTRIKCAVAGMKTVLTAMQACSDASCTTNSSGVATTPVHQFGIMAFPPRAVTAGNIAKDYDCSSSSATTKAYNATASTMSYMVLPLQSNYKATSSSTTLNASANIVKAVGGGGTGCNFQLSAPGGQGSFLAGAITAAKNALTVPAAGVTNTSNVRTTSTKVIVVLSDGDAQADSDKVTTYAHQCTQGVTAANAAKTAGILVYTIAYGAGSGGCASDTGVNDTTACNSMKAMATVGTSTARFYSTDGTATGSGKCTSVNAYTTLSAIFNSIQGSIASLAGAQPRLIPDTTI